MPRPRKPELEGKEVKKRSRNGCWPCKSRKVKCGEEKPACLNCQRQGETCDYSIRLNWDGRSKKKEDGKPGSNIISFAPAASPPLPSSTSSVGTPYTDGATPMTYPSLGSPMPPTLHPAPSLQESALPPVAQFSVHAMGQTAEYPAVNLLPAPPILRNPTWGERTHNPNISQLRPSLPLSSYPSPAESGFGSPGMPVGLFPMNGYSSQMPPPMTSNPTNFQESVSSPYNSAKRVRLSPQTDVFGNNPALLQRASSYGPTSSLDETNRVQFNPHTPTFLPSYLNQSNPLTPAASSASISQDDDRRISVSSLLSEDPEPSSSKRTSGSEAPPTSHAYLEPVPEPGDDQNHAEEAPPRRGSLHQRMISYSDTETWGHDRGSPDFDIPRNNDAMAISGMSPSEHSDFGSWLEAEYEDPAFGFGIASREQVFAKGGYYSTPVPIKIPRKLEPLPTTLSENPMNLLYFHHFLNHTARILVPHDCPENPFKTILPKMAVENPNLLNLLLAYSACHRARLLNHAEPASRIAVWVRDVFPALRHTLENVSNPEISNANLATAIMLASLEIISPSSFGVSIPWQNHLSIARSIIRSRGGPHSVSRKDPVMYFLTRWMAYLDVLGSLSGRRNEEPLFAGDYWSSSHEVTSAKELRLDDDDEYDDDEDDYTIDCLLGFTTRCVSILAHIALLARECEPLRLSADGKVNTEWRPPPEILERAEKLKTELITAREHEQKQCTHHSPQMSKATPVGVSQPERRMSYAAMSRQDAEESLATNSAFHWSGMVHLLRRVHNLPRSHPDVQSAVKEIIKTLITLREGGSAEACLLFPMFTAGVEAEDKLDQAEVMRRVKGAEGLGMMQVSRARKVMEECWRTGEGWEGMVSGEFFG